MKQLVVLSLIFIQGLVYGQTYNPYYASIVTNCEYDSVETYLNEFTALGIKELGTTALDNTKDWILDKYASWGYTDMVEDPFTYSGSTTENIIVTKQGSVYPNTYLIIDGHYDTKNGAGSNDNGSGTAVILEMARILKDIETEYSIKFIHFSGEEDGLVGSQHYVDNTVIPQNLDILLVYNIDEVGGVSSMVNDVIVCERDESSPSGNNTASNTATNTLAGCIELYSNLSTEISYAYSSDYMPFQNNGEIITGLFEKNQSPYAHTFFDDMSNLDIGYIFEITKGGLGAALEFAIAIQDDAGLEEETTLTYEVYPNPNDGSFWVHASDYTGQTIHIEINTASGETICSETVKNYQTPIHIELTGQAEGMYFLNVRIGTNTKTTKILLN